MTFNMPVDPGTINGNITVSEAGSEISGKLSCNENVVTFDPDTNFSKDLIFSVKIGDGITSTNKIPMEKSYEWKFSTGFFEDKIPPVMSGSPNSVSVRSTGFEIRWAAAIDNVTPAEDIEYLVYIAPQSSQLSTVTPFVVRGRCQYTVRGLNPGTKRFFAVRARDAAGNICDYSAFANETTNARYPFVVTDGEVRATALNGSTLFFGGLFNYAGIPARNTAVIDSLTGQTSTAVVNPLVDGNVNIAVSDEVGGWYIGGSFTSVNGIARNNIARINSDGSVHDFNPNPSGQVMAIVVSADAKSVYFSGNFNQVRGKTHLYIAKVNAFDGSVVLTWNTSLSTYAEALEISGSYLYVGGVFSDINGVSIGRLARVDTTTGAVDQSWKPSPNGAVLCIDINGTTLYVGGSFSNIGGEARSNAAEIRRSDGTATGWNPSPDNTVFDIVSDPYSDYVYLGGFFSNVLVNATTYKEHNRICRVSKSNGFADSWSDKGTDTGAVSKVTCLEMFAGGVYAGGKFSRHVRKVQLNASCVGTNGFVESLWKNGFDGSGVSSIAFNSDGSAMFVCGSISSSMWPRSNAAAYDIDTGKLTGWKPDPDNTVKAIALGNGAAYIGGSFSAHLSKTNLLNGTVEKDGGDYWSADGDVNTLLIDPTEANIYVGGPFAKIKSDDVSNAEGYVLSSGNRMTGWNNYLTASNMSNVNSLIWFNPSSSIFVGGEFGYSWINPPDSIEIKYFAKCSYSGNLDTTYDANVPGIVQAACTDNVSMVIVAGAGFINSYNTGSAASGWSKTLASTTKDVFAMQYLSSGKLYVGGNFSYSEGSVSRNFLSRFDVTLSGQPLENWGPVIDQAGVYAMSAGADMIVVGGTFNTVDGKSHKGIAAIDIATGTAWE